jgi:hypothetical protein
VTGAAVRAWSTQRLPFEPKGWLKVYRDELRGALRSMSPIAGALLHAEYASPDRQFADVENVLLYNVGAGSYRHLSGSGLLVSRTQSPDTLHRVSYQLIQHVPSEMFCGSTVASVSLEEFPSAPDKAASWWAAIRDKVSIGSHEITPEYTVEVHLREVAPRFVSLVKPMLDGMISALHNHDGSNADHIRNALESFGEPTRLWSLLVDPSTSVLGRRVLVRPHGPGIAWNPADERCSAFSIMPTVNGPALNAVVRSA